jgi:type VI secretion system secreted protein VgrG
MFALLSGTSPASAQSSLGASQSFAVLAGSTVTNTGSTTVTGNLGVSPGSAVVGFPPGLLVGGTIHAADAVALNAQNAVTTAYNSLASQPCTQTLTGQDLGGLTLTPGVYCFSSSAQLTGTLTLNAQGDSNALFIFKVGSAITTASGSSVVVINGGLLCNVFWQVGSSATLGTGTAFIGNILALTSITMNTGATLQGRALARNGAVTLASNTITASCLVALPPGSCPPIALSPAVLPNGSVGAAYSQTLAASGGTPPYTFRVSSGALPAGLTLSPTGMLTGTPTTAATANFTIEARDANGCIAFLAYTIVVAGATTPPVGCPTITLAPATLPNGRVGVAYLQTLTGSGGTGPYTFAVTSGTLPAGLTLAPGGLLSGTPSTATTSVVTIRGTDVNGCFASVPLTVVIAAAPAPPPGCPPVTLTPAMLPNGTTGVLYNQTITGNGGTGPYTFGVVAGALPAGLTLTPGGILSGTPTTTGTSSLTIRGTDANGCFAELPYTMTITTAVPTLPQTFALLLAAGLAGLGYVRLRRPRSVSS